MTRIIKYNLDMDGVFVHSEWAKHIAETRVFRYFGPEMTDEDIMYFKGRTNRGQFSYAIEKNGWNTTWQECADLKLKFYKEYMASGKVHLFHGFWDFYEANEGLMAVTTSSSMAEYNALSEIFGFNGKFPVVVTADDVEALGLKGKPSPDPYILTAERLQAQDFDVTGARIVEDSTSGIYSGFEAGMPVIGMTHLLGHSRQYAPGTITKEVDHENRGNTKFFDPGYSVQVQRSGRTSKEIVGLKNTGLTWAMDSASADEVQKAILRSGRFKLTHHFYDLIQR